MAISPTSSGWRSYHGTQSPSGCCFSPTQNPDRLNQARKLFADLWLKFAGDFTDKLNAKEYNSIKHGLRVRSGGFSLKIGREHEYGVPPPEKEMMLMGSSEFGTSFFLAEKISGAPPQRKDPHFRVHRWAISWDAEAMAYGLNLIAMSIKNVVSFLKISNGVDPKTVQFTRPAEDDYFCKPWERSSDVLSIGMDSVVPEGSIYRASEEEILKLLGKKKKERSQ